MRGSLRLSVALVLWLALPCRAAGCDQRVAVIGGGIGGSYAAYLLSNYTAPRSIPLDVFDAGYGGGRAQEFTFDGEVMELGASMIYGGNHYMKQMTAQMGLTTKTYDDGSSWMHIYNGKQVVLQMGSSSLRNTLSVVARYGLAPLAYGAFTRRMFSNFSAIYGLQDGGAAYASVAALLQAMHLHALTQQRCNDTLQGVLRRTWWVRLWGAHAFAEELAASVNRCNYNQRNSELNAFAGAVSYLPAADPDVWAVREGNGEVARRLLAASGAQLHLNTSVAAVQQAGHQYTLLLQDGTTRGPYDAVLIAAPLTTASLSLPPSAASVPPRQYQTTISTFVRGALQSDYFQPPPPPHTTCTWQLPGSNRVVALLARIFSMCMGALEKLWQGVVGGGGGGLRMPLDSQVFVTEGSEAPFTAIAVKKVLGPTEALYKVFSSQPLSNTTLTAIFGPRYHVLTTKAWAAYPKYSPPEALPPFQLAPGLYYGNAIEAAASAMEMSAIAARNNALLAAEHLATSCSAAQAA